MCADHTRALPVVSCPGLQCDSLGRYLAALGLLEVLARARPSVRGAWSEDGFRIVGGPHNRRALAGAVLDIARANGFRRYDRAWMDSQSRDTKEGGAENIAVWRSDCTEEECDLVDAHLVTSTRLCFNPVLGTGGNSGRRDFANGWEQALAVIEESKDARKVAVERDLEHFLFGGACTTLGYWNSGSWFSNHIPPWAMVLACTALPLLAGKASRRLGANTRRLAAFPFTTEAAAPVRENEAGRSLGEFWAPVWQRPLSVPELSALFARGRAEQGRRQAVTAASFATAIVQRGVDAGITEFRRFALTRTTSSQTFESTLVKTISLQHEASRYAAATMERAVRLRDRLPRDERRNERWIFRGLRGPVDEALVDLAAEPDDFERAGALMDAIWCALERVDNNKNYRESGMAFQLLPVDWLDHLFTYTYTEPPAEALVAMALASLQPRSSQRGQSASFLPYRLGVEPRGRKGEWFDFPKEVPARRVWTGSDLVRGLGLVLRRRLLDAGGLETPLRATRAVPIATIASFLHGELDDHAIVRWLGRMCLFDWQRPGAADRPRPSHGDWIVDGPLSLYGFLKPLFHVKRGQQQVAPIIDPESGAASTAALSRIAALLQAGDVDRAIAEARSRYRVAGRVPAAMTVTAGITDPARLLAALLIPTSSESLVPLAERWLAPVRSKENTP
jgi:CRISPR-associated protein Csx17